MQEMPGEVMGLIDRGAQRLHNTTGALKWLTEDNILTAAALTQIDEIRRALATIDIALLDASNIVEGYLNYQSSPQPTPLAEEDTIETPAPELANLIEEFRNSLGEIDEVAPSQST
jgi:hypothetical protein